MKTNGRMCGSGSPGLIPGANYSTSWALFFSKFFTAYANAGINFWGLTVQNEPEFAAPWEACVYDPDQELDFVRNYLGPRLQSDWPNIKIMIYDHNKNDVVTWAQTILSDPVASKYVWGTAVHWYTGPQFNNLATTHNLFPNKTILATEACNCPMSLNNWGYGENYGYDIIGDLNNWAVGWTDWNMLLDLQGGPNHLNNYCDAPVIADTNNQVLYYEPSYYYMGQISRFIVPGSVRVGVTLNGNASGLSVTAFLRPDGNVAVVVMNNGNSNVGFTLQDGNNYAQYTSYAHSIVSFIYQKF